MASYVPGQSGLNNVSKPAAASEASGNLHFFIDLMPYNLSMDIKALTQAMHQLVTAKGWYEPASPRQQTARNLATSLMLEAAEVLEHFQWQDEIKDPPALAAELADVALYLLQLAHISGIDLEQAIHDKIEVNYQREWDQPDPKD